MPGVVARAGVAAAARRQHRHDDRVAVRDRSLGGGAPADVRPRPALRDRSAANATGGISTVDVKTLVPRLGGRVRPDRRRQDHPAGHLRPLRRQVQRRAVLAQLQRRQPRSLRDAVHRRRPARAANFAAGFDPANYTTTVSGTFPTANVFFADDARSPLTREYTVGAGARDRPEGLRCARPTSIARRPTSSRTSSRSTAAAPPSAATACRRVRQHRLRQHRPRAARVPGVSTCWAAYRFGPSLSVNGQWTVQLENDGNFEGEAANNPAIPSLIGDYPEVYVADRSFPMGRLDDFQRHKVRVWANYSLRHARVRPARRRAALPLQLAADLQPRGAVRGADARSRRRSIPATCRLPSSQPVFFGARGSQEFERLRAVRSRA